MRPDFEADVATVSEEPAIRPARPRWRLRVLVATVALMIFPVGSFLGPLGDTPEPYREPVLFLVVDALLLGIVVWAFRRRRLTLRQIFGAKPSFPTLATAAGFSLPMVSLSLGALYLVYYPLSLIAPGAVEDWVLDDSLLVSSPSGDLPLLPNAILFVSGVIIGPVLEELLFRGIIQRSWVARDGARRGLLGTSLLFGLLHVVDVVGCVAFGLVAGLLYLTTRSLWPSIVLHVTNNALAFLADGVWHAVYGSSATTVNDFQSEWWLGAVGLAVGLPWFVWFVWRNFPAVSRRFDE